MLTKKEMNPNQNEKKKKKGKNKRHLLTSMTSHIVDKTKELAVEEYEEPPEDDEDHLPLIRETPEEKV